MDELSVKSKPKVLVFKSTLPVLSETFIKNQCLNLSEWQPVMVGRNLADDGLDLTGLNICLLNNNRTLFSKAILLLRLLMQRPSKTDVELLKNENAKLIHAHYGPQGVLVWPLAKTLNLPLIVTLHGADINIYRESWEKGRNWMRLYPYYLLSLAKERNVRFIAVSKAIKERAIEYGIPPEKIDVNYIGVDTQQFIPGSKPLAERKEILFVGRLVEKKGCRYLLEAFVGIQDQFPEYNLVIVGSGPLENELKKYAQNNGVRAEFLGPQTSEQICERMRSTTYVFCLPSITAESGDAEGLPISILEAQSCGVPVVTSARGGATEGIIHEVTGLSHREKDVEGIRDALIRLLSNDQMAEKFGEAARRNIVTRMDIRDCARSLEKLYFSLTYTN